MLAHKIQGQDGPSGEITGVDGLCTSGDNGDCSSSYGPSSVTPQHVQWWVVEFQPITGAIRALDSVPFKFKSVLRCYRCDFWPVEGLGSIIFRPAPLDPLAP